MGREEKCDLLKEEVQNKGKFSWGTPSMASLRVRQHEPFRALAKVNRHVDRGEPTSILYLDFQIMFDAVLPEKTQQSGNKRAGPLRD